MLAWISFQVADDLRRYDDHVTHGNDYETITSQRVVQLSTARALSGDST